MAKTFKSDALESIHDSARALLEIGAINNATLGDFGVACSSGAPAESLQPDQRDPGRNNRTLKTKVMPDAAVS